MERRNLLSKSLFEKFLAIPSEAFFHPHVVRLNNNTRKIIKRETITKFNLFHELLCIEETFFKVLVQANSKT